MNSAQTLNARAWTAAVITGVAIPVLALMALSARGSGISLAGGPVLTLGLMGVGIIAAATSGRFWVGVLLALLSAVCLIVLARALGMSALAHPLSAEFKGVSDVLKRGGLKEAHADHKQVRLLNLGEKERDCL
ncbi:MAG: hypothetical protein AAFU65_15990 [Pseudomonadota bacterium]